MKKRSFLIFMLVIAMLAMVSCNTAKGMKEDVKETAEDVKDLVTMSADEVKDFMDTEKDYYVVDARGEKDYKEGHIKGAIRVDDDNYDSILDEKLKDKNRPVLVYGDTSENSQKAAKRFLGSGYKDVREFGAMKDWPYEVEK